jgi:hypothetical protein
MDRIEKRDAQSRRFKARGRCGVRGVKFAPQTKLTCAASFNKLHIAILHERYALAPVIRWFTRRALARCASIGTAESQSTLIWSKTMLDSRGQYSPVELLRASDRSLVLPLVAPILLVDVDYVPYLMRPRIDQRNVPTDSDVLMIARGCRQLTLQVSGYGMSPSAKVLW